MHISWNFTIFRMKRQHSEHTHFGNLSDSEYATRNKNACFVLMSISDILCFATAFPHVLQPSRKSIIQIAIASIPRNYD